MKLHLTLAIALLGTALSPLSSVAQQAEAQSAIVIAAEHQRDWDRGNRLETSGLVDLAAAESELTRYNAEMATAQTARDAAQARVDNARTEFETLAAQATTVSDPDRARRFGQDIKKFAEDWESFDDRVRAADRTLERALSRQRQTQEAVNRAQATVDRGRAVMAEAERLSSDRN